MEQALKGVRVADFSDLIAGAYCTMLLATCGAEVIRVESEMHQGFRRSGPYVKRPGVSSPEEIKKLPISPVFGEFNRNKLSITLNMAKPKGRELARQLIKTSDVVIDNFRSGVMQKWEMDYPNLIKIKSNIIAVGLQPMGANGPYRKWVTWGPNLLSFVGFSYEWNSPDASEIVGYQGAYADYIVAGQAAGAIVAALLHRAQTGEGQHIDVSQAEVTASLLGTVYMDYFVNKRNSLPRGNRHPQFAPYNCYRCKGDDEWCVIAVTSEDEWQHFCEALDNPPWTADLKFKDAESRLKNAEALDINIERWTLQYTPHQVMRILQNYGVAAGAVQDNEELFHDLQLRNNGFLVEQKVPKLGGITYPGIPLHFSETPIHPLRRAPLIGEHNEYVYCKLLGLSLEKIKKLVEEKVIF